MSAVSDVDITDQKLMTAKDHQIKLESMTEKCEELESLVNRLVHRSELF